MIYLDSCALIKLVRAEPGAAALAAWLEAYPTTPWVSSGLVRVEVNRALRRVSACEEQLDQAAELLDNLTSKPVDTVLGEASQLPGEHLRSLDAIHLATALAAGEALTAFVSYDRRLAQAAREAGLTVAQPG